MRGGGGSEGCRGTWFSRSDLKRPPNRLEEEAAGGVEETGERADAAIVFEGLFPAPADPAAVMTVPPVLEVERL